MQIQVCLQSLKKSERGKYRWENNIKIDLKKNTRRNKLDTSASATGEVTASYE